MESPRPEPGFDSSSRVPRLSMAARSCFRQARPVVVHRDRQKRAGIPLRPAAQGSRARGSLPTSRHCRRGCRPSPRDPAARRGTAASGATSLERDVPVAVDLRRVRSEPSITGATSVAAPTEPARAAARARSRYQFTWSRIIAACSRTLSASGPGSAPASLTMTLSGVFRAWARLPTWVRARSRISRLASISRLTSAASGARSSG